MVGCCCAEACTAAVLLGVMRLPGCPFGGAWSVRFVGWADWVDCRCFLSFVFLGVARRLELSPCNTDMRQAVHEGQNTGTGTVAPAATTTEIRGMTHDLANLEVTNPTPAPPAATTATIAWTSAHNRTAPIVNLPEQEINMAVQAAATAAAANVRADFVAVMRQFAQVPSASTSRRADTVNVHNLKLPEFQGIKKDASNYIEPKSYLPLLSWTREVRTLLVVSGLSQRHQALSIINALTGAWRR